MILKYWTKACSSPQTFNSPTLGEMKNEHCGHVFIFDIYREENSKPPFIWSSSTITSKHTIYDLKPSQRFSNAIFISSKLCNFAFDNPCMNPYVTIIISILSVIAPSSVHFIVLMIWPTIWFLIMATASTAKCSKTTLLGPFGYSKPFFVQTPLKLRRRHCHELAPDTGGLRKTLFYKYFFHS